MPGGLPNQAGEAFLASVPKHQHCVAQKSQRQPSLSATPAYEKKKRTHQVRTALFRRHSVGVSKPSPDFVGRASVLEPEGAESTRPEEQPHREEENRCFQTTLARRRSVPFGQTLPPSSFATDQGWRRLSLRCSPGGVVLGAFRLVTDVAAMLACEHRLRPRPFLGVLPRNCTSYSSRDRATSAILSDDHQDGRPTSAPVWCRSMSNSTQWASAAEEADPQPQPEPEQQRQQQQQQATECRGPGEPASATARTSPPAETTAVTQVLPSGEAPSTPPPAVAQPEAEVTTLPVAPKAAEPEPTRPDASARLQPPAAVEAAAAAPSDARKPSPAPSSVASAADAPAVGVVVPDTSPSWAGPSHIGVSVSEPSGGSDSERLCTGSLQNNNNSGSPGQEVSATTPVRDKQANKTCCFCWCCCCSCSCLALKSNNGNVRSPRDNNQRLTAGDSFLNGDGEPPPTLEEIRMWGDSFEKLMKCSAGRKVFRDFLKCEYSEENILFWLACEDLKQESNPEMIEEKARAIYEDYISILSPKEVSLDSRVREIINRNMVEPTPHTFDEAQLQIYTLMHRDSYPRFVNSPLFRKLAQLPSPSRKGSAA